MVTDLNELEPDGWLGSWCAQCGPDVRVDEDGCCLACGIDAVGHGADEACRALDRADRAEAELKALRERVEVLPRYAPGIVDWEYPTHVEDDCGELLERDAVLAALRDDHD